MMQLHHHNLFGAAAALVSLAIGVSSARLSHAQEPPAPPVPGLPPAADVAPAGAETEGIETLTRGPVHEAFAAPTATEPEPSAVVAKKPPEPIDEVAPDFKPEGAIWVPGYWEWDVASEDFIWISGLWRVPPPDMRWVPPYWTEAEGGWQRVPGFWISADMGELEYREKPPTTLEVGPSTPAPGENYFYIPGSWSYYDTGYRWRTGYWSPYRADWIWSPARWSWTPAGYVHCGGFWDRRPLWRGSLFAPIGFRSQVYLRPGFRYRPWCVVDTNRLFVNLWIGPRSNCYYFGNYYGGGNRWGFQPWCNWNYRNRNCYDPIWSWSNVHYRRQGVDYIGRMQGWNRYYERNENDRPPRNWDEQRRLIAEGRSDRTKGQNILANDLGELARRDDLPIRLARVDERERERIRQVSDEIRELRNERGRLEREVATTVGDRRGNRGDNDRPGRGDREPGEGRGPDAGNTAEGRPDRPGRGDDAGRTADRTGENAEGRADAEDRNRTERRNTARMTLPKPSAELERVTRASTVDRPRSLEDSNRESRGPNSRGSDQTARTGDRPGEDRPGSNRPGGNPSRERGGRDADDAARTGRTVERPSGADETARTARERTGDQPGRGEQPKRSDTDAASALQDRIREARERAENRGNERATPRTERAETPRVERTETPRVERPETPRVERSETPRINRPETPRVERSETPRVERTETPRVERPETPRVERSETPRINRPETPRVERSETPRVERTETPRVERPETPRVERSETPRINRPETPRVERSETPRAERSSTPRVERTETPRIETRRVETPRAESPRTEAPRVERTAPQPRVERSTPQPRVERSTPQPRVNRSSAPRMESSRPSGGAARVSGGSSSRASGGGNASRSSISRPAGGGGNSAARISGGGSSRSQGSRPSGGGSSSRSSQSRGRK